MIPSAAFDCISSTPFPSGIALIGIVLIMLGMILHSTFSKTKIKKPVKISSST